jgi:hypothetical protein
LNAWPFIIGNGITGKEIAGNGLLAMKRNSPTHQQHPPGRRRRGLSVKLANMSRFLAVAGALLIIDIRLRLTTNVKKVWVSDIYLVKRIRAIGEFRYIVLVKV